MSYYGKPSLSFNISPTESIHIIPGNHLWNELRKLLEAASETEEDGGPAFELLGLINEVEGKGEALVDDLAAAQATIQQHEATIAELKTKVSSVHLEASDDLGRVYEKLAAAQATIHQQARELEEADEALFELFQIRDRDYGISDETVTAFQTARSRLEAARHSARALQAEAKKEEK